MFSLITYPIPRSEVCFQFRLFSYVQFQSFPRVFYTGVPQSQFPILEAQTPGEK